MPCAPHRVFLSAYPHGSRKTKAGGAIRCLQMTCGYSLRLAPPDEYQHSGLVLGYRLGRREADTRDGHARDEDHLVLDVVRKVSGDIARFGSLVEGHCTVEAGERRPDSSTQQRALLNLYIRSWQARSTAASSCCLTITPVHLRRIYYNIVSRLSQDPLLGRAWGDVTHMFICGLGGSHRTIKDSRKGCVRRGCQPVTKMLHVLTILPDSSTMRCVTSMTQSAHPVGIHRINLGICTPLQSLQARRPESMPSRLVMRQKDRESAEPWASKQGQSGG